MNSENHPGNRKWVDPNELQLGPIQHKSLPVKLLARIQRIHDTFAEVDGISLEDRIDAFRRDIHPENEVALWASVADAYQVFCEGRELAAEAKKEAYSVALMRSMTSAEEVLRRMNLKAFSREDAVDLLRGFR